MQKITKSLPFVAGISISFIFGFSFLFSKQSLSAMTPFELMAHRFIIAAAFLLIIAWFGRGSAPLKLKWDWKMWRDLIPLALFQPIIYFIGETYGIKLTTVSESSLVIALIPVATALLGVYFLKERVSFWQWIFIFLSVVGIALITLFDTKVNTGSHFLGILILVGAVIAAAIYTILSRHFSRKYTPFEITFVMMSSGAVFFNAVYLVAAKPGMVYFDSFFNFSSLVSLLYLGLLSSVVAFFLVNYMLTKMKASQVTTFVNLTTVVSVAAGVIFRGESFGPIKLVGGLLIIIGVWGISVSKAN